ncbi:helix-turn-helix transcriptional regulator [Halorarius litoreus]|uniref:helix-turn-helix transcriptional regulator n=1 Tax=Halorarius litoreus TaxID=2962676 RepID=UPI0020CD4039|nr:hypothetical protein [Halorarius litoreus]
MARTLDASVVGHLWGAVVVLCLLSAPVVGATAPAQGASGQSLAGPDRPVTADVFAPENGTGLTRTNVTGDAVASHQNGTVYVWQNETVTVRATVVPFDGAGSYQLCLDVRDDEDAIVVRERCRTVDVSPYATRTSIDTTTPAGNATGDHTLVLTLSDEDDSQTTRLPVVVVTRDGELDSDSLNNSQEVEYGSALEDPDTDSDGLLDGLEVTKYNSSPTEADTDGDGLRDGREINIDTDPRSPDTDGDGLDDGREVALGTNPKKVDTDGDGLDDARELELGTDPTEADTDDDGLDDARELELGTDPTDPDTDGDGFEDGTEVDRGWDPQATTTRTPGETARGGSHTPSASDPMFLVGAGTLVLGTVLGVGYLHQKSANDVDAGDSDSRSDRPLDGVVDDRQAPESAVDPELLSPEQHVMHLLEVNDGRMRQSQFVEETDWSKAKVSRKLSALEDAGEIERTRIGRENIVTVPDRDLEDT